jgi:hypothetical protein
MPIHGRRQDIDLCVADIVAALNAANVTTGMSCCGHGEQHGVISLDDGRWLIVVQPESIGQQIEKDEIDQLVSTAFRGRDESKGGEK